jgi:hypothetical protein
VAVVAVEARVMLQTEKLEERLILHKTRKHPFLMGPMECIAAQVVQLADHFRSQDVPRLERDCFIQ